MYLCRYNSLRISRWKVPRFRVDPKSNDWYPIRSRREKFAQRDKGKKANWRLSQVFYLCCHKPMNTRKLNLYLKTFPQGNFQAKTALLVNSIKHLKEKYYQIYTNSYRNLRRYVSQLVFWGQHYLNTQARQKTLLQTNIFHEYRCVQILNKIVADVIQNI